MSEEEKYNQGNIQSRDIVKEMSESYLNYSMSVIVSRALPDVRDGLKPVHRRVLFGASDLGATWNRSHKKSARIVGEVLGKYHPHGDSSVYDSLVRMAQPWSLRYPLIDGQGNFGSIDGDNAAAMRYTEARMGKISAEMLQDIDKNTVQFAPNFDDSLEEPTVLPTIIPNLLMNGSEGIAVGMATKIPPHNLRELVTGLKALLENPEISIEELVENHIKGPDFPTGGYIMGIDGINSAYSTGRGRVVMRGKATTEELDSGKERIIISEIPYQVNKSNLVEKIAAIAKTSSPHLWDLYPRTNPDSRSISASTLPSRRSTAVRSQLQCLRGSSQRRSPSSAYHLTVTSSRHTANDQLDLVGHAVKLKRSRSRHVAITLLGGPKIVSSLERVMTWSYPM